MWRMRLALFLPLMATSAWAESPAIELMDHAAPLFAQRDVAIRLRVRDVTEANARLGWSLAAYERTIQAGEVALLSRDSQELSLPLQSIDLRTGLSPQATLSLRILDHQSRTLAETVQEYWVLAPAVFAGQRTALESLQIRLFDPLDKTAEVFEQAGVPFRALPNLQELEALDAGLLVVAEGLALDETRGLEVAIELALRRGLSVLCLAPTEGSLIVPGLTAEVGVVPASVAFEDLTFLCRRDKRLSSDAWLGRPDSIPSRVKLTVEGERTVGKIGRDAEGWPSIEVTFDRPRRKFIYCGVPIIGVWEANPAPRYLLSAMLQEFLASPPSTPAETNHE